MFTIIGWVIVIGVIIGGYIMAGGHVAILMQPIEVLIIFGAAAGATLAGNTMTDLKAFGSGIGAAFKGSAYTKQKYMETLGLMFNLFAKARKDGLMSVEGDIEEPENSETFKKAPLVAKDHHATDFIADYMRLMISSSLDVHQIDNLMDVEIETHHHEASVPGSMMSKLADALPAFGIVAAVLGVVHTMESVSLPPAELGKLIAAALVGTFLGILAAYGFFAPLANVMTKQGEEGTVYFNCLKATLIAFMNGYPPQVAVEFGRKTLPSHLRPGFRELEEFIKSNK
ncbi:MAG: flagellar motor stator protein MotA [Pseudomonadota bacterium]